MLNFVDKFLNSITMYRLVLYYLILLLVVAFIYSIFGVLPFAPLSLFISVVVLLIVCYVSNKAMAKVLNVQTNVESLYITALILACIITPNSNYVFLIVAGLIAMASKYVLNIKGKHLFNPVAITLVITAFTIHGYASWWIATASMFPFLLLGFLIVRKIRREKFVFYFLLASLISTFVLFFSRGNFDVAKIIKNTFLDSPILFFAFVMLTEPLTSPPTIFLQGFYGAIVGLLFAPIHLGFLYTTPEIALSIGNIFSYLVSPKEKLILTLKKKLKLTDTVYDFVYSANQKLNFKAGQYLEWTLGHSHTDTRGNRRYFTVASSPTENEIRIGVKVEGNKSSSFKREMLSMKIGDKIVASQLAGEFTLPKDINKKFVFIAGGIGVTPFRSIIKYLIDTNTKCDIVLMYSERKITDFVYKDIFDEGINKIGMRIIYFETEKSGHMTANIIRNEIPDYKDRIYYLSGPHGMVASFENSLSEMKLPKTQIKVDYFPGF